MGKLVFHGKKFKVQSMGGGRRGGAGTGAASGWDLLGKEDIYTYTQKSCAHQYILEVTLHTPKRRMIK